MRSGARTSEFWLVLGTLVTGVVMGIYALSKSPEHAMAAAAIIGALSPHTIGYAIARTKAKRGDDA